MNIPKKIRIGSMDYEIIYCESPLIVDNKVCFGSMDYDKKTIKIAKGMQNIQGEEETFLHEIFHAVCAERNFTYAANDDETITEELARGWHQVIRDNQELFLPCSFNICETLKNDDGKGIDTISKS